MSCSPLVARAAPALIALSLAAPPRAVASPDDPLALVNSGHLKRARAAIEARAAASPEDPRTLYLLARLKLFSGQAAEALPIAERAAALAPQNPDHRYQVAECVGSMARRAGMVKGLGLGKRFRREAEAALALDPRHVDAHEGLIEFYSVAPRVAGGSDKQARALAAALVGIDPARGRLAQATLALRDKQEARAEEALRQALAAEPGSYPVRMALARHSAGEARKRWAESEEHARAAIALEPGRVSAWSLLAYLFAHLERWEELDRTLARAEAAVPDNLHPYYQAARTLLADERDPARAERYLRKFLSQEPEPSGPTLAHAHWRLGLAIEKQGRRGEALAQVETAVRLKPDLEDAKKDLKRMKKG